MIRQIVSTFFTRFFIAVSNLAIAILLSNFTGAAGRGEQSLIITLITFIIIITSIVGSSSISYLLPRHPFIALIIPSYLWVILITGICYIVLPFLNLIQSGYIPDICILSLMLAIININTAVLISKQRISAVNHVGLLQALVIVAWLLISFLIFGNKTINAYITALYLGYGSGLALSFAYTLGYFRKTAIKPLPAFVSAAKRLATLGFYNQVAVFAQMLSFRLSYYLLSAYFGNESVGVYSNAVSIAESVWLIGRSMATVQHSKIVNSSDINYSIRLTTGINKINLLISGTLVLILALIPGSFYIVVFGNEFTNINRIIWTLGPGIMFFGIALVLGFYFSSTGKHYVNAVASMAGLIATIILGFTLIPQFETYGAGIASSISYGITALVVMYFYSREKKRH